MAKAGKPGILNGLRLGAAIHITAQVLGKLAE